MSKNKNYLKFLFLIFFVGFINPTNSFSQDSSVSKKVLIVIGYQDENKENFLFSHQFYFSTAQYIEYEIQLSLRENGYKKKFNNQFENIKKNVHVTLINANVLCLSENFDRSLRNSICEQQRNHSLAIKNYIATQLPDFHEFYYIGHSRMGLGLGLGPFSPEYTFKLEFYNDQEVGKLNKVSLVSCDSLKYYASIFSQLKQVKFDTEIAPGKITMTQALSYLKRQIQYIEN